MGPTTGIELELWVIDRRGELADGAPLVEALPFVDPEILRPLVEVKTEPHRRLSMLFRELRERLLRALAEADGHHLRLFAAGTPLNRGPLPTVPSPRLALQERIDPEDLALERVLARAGLHVHFARDPDPRVTRDRVNLLTALDPLAAAANASPYLGRRRVASSSRNLLYHVRSRSRFAERSRLWSYAGSVADWEGRLDRLWGEYPGRARECGIPPAELRRELRPDDSLWTPVRLRRDPSTIEYRSADAAPPGRILPVVEALARVVRLADRGGVELPEEPGREVTRDGSRIVLPPFLVLRALSEEAARLGLRSEPLRAYLARLGIEPEAFRPLEPTVTDGDALDDRAARRLRLRWADELERDLLTS